MNRKVISLALDLIVVALLMAGCGNAATAAPTATTSALASPSPSIRTTTPIRPALDSSPTPTLIADATSTAKALAATATALALPPPVQVEVKANVKWQDTGINVRSGDIVKIRYVAGQWSIWMDVDPLTDGDGQAGRPENCQIMPEANLGALIGRVGINPPFLIGNAAEIHSDYSGNLQLSINDCGDFRDNGGTLTVVVNTPTLAVPAPTLTMVATPSPNTVETITLTPGATRLPDPTPGVIQWNETIPIPNPSSAPFDTTRGQQLVFHNGYVYIFGGRNATDDRLTNVYFSAIQPDGTLADWTETTSLPGKYYDHVVVKTGDYIYLLTGAASVEDVYYAPFNADGSIGAWKQTASLSPSRQTFAAVGHGNFIYAAGGNSGGTQDFVQYTSVKSDGSVNPWAYTTPLPVTIQEHTMIAHDGYLYVFGGKNENDEWATAYFSAINPNGTLAGWKTTTPLPQKMSGYSTFESNGYVYLLGGDSSSYYTRILENHALDAWQIATALPTIRLGLWAGAYNGYAYAVGGYDLVRYQSTVYYGWIGSQVSVENPVVEHPDCTAGWTRLQAGGQAKVSEESSTPNRVRTEPSQVSDVITLLPPGTIVKVLEGPVCADGLIFWKVESEAIPGGVGWTAEGDGAEYYLVLHTP